MADSTARLDISFEWKISYCQQRFGRLYVDFPNTHIPNPKQLKNTFLWKRKQHTPPLSLLHTNRFTLTRRCKSGILRKIDVWLDCKKVTFFVGNYSNKKLKWKTFHSLSRTLFDKIHHLMSTTACACISTELPSLFCDSHGKVCVRVCTVYVCTE